MSLSKRKYTRLTAICLAALFANGSYVAAAPETTEPDRQVIVTASRTRQMIQDTPAAVEVITRDRLDKIGAHTLLEALRLSPSITISPAMVGSGVSIRGMENRHVLLMIDGHRLTSEGSHSTANSYEWDRINLDNVERIEIVRGMASSLYGSDALGGVINVITKKTGTAGGFLSYALGRYDGNWGTDDLTFHYDTGRQGRTAWSFNLGKMRTDSFIHPHTRYSNYYGTRKFWDITGTYYLSPEKTLDLHFDNLDEDMQQNTPILPRSDFTNNRKNYSLTLHGKKKDGDYELRTYWGRQEKTQDNYNPVTGIWTRGVNLSTRKTQTLEGRSSFQLNDQQLLTVGGELRKEEYEGTRVKNHSANMDYSAFYLQDEWVPQEKWILIPSIRYDHSDKFGNNISPKLGVTYKLQPHLRLKLNIGKGFKAPSLDDMYMDMRMGMHARVIGNPNLRPEKSTNYEIGIEGERGTLFSKLSLFQSNVNDLIALQKVSPLPGNRDMTFVNKNKANITGLEWEIGKQINLHWQIKCNYTYLDAADDKGGRIPGRARHQGSLQFQYDSADTRNISALLWNTWYQDYIHSDYTPKSYTLWNLAVHKKWNPTLSGYVGVDNLFDKQDYDLNLMGTLWRAGVKVSF